MNKELDESFIGAITYKSNYGSAIEHEIKSTSISTALVLAEALKTCGYNITKIIFIKKEGKNG